jgi:hypothetical protein
LCSSPRIPIIRDRVIISDDVIIREHVLFCGNLIIRHQLCRTLGSRYQCNLTKACKQRSCRTAASADQSTLPLRTLVVLPTFTAPRFQPGTPDFVSSTWQTRGRDCCGRAIQVWIAPDVKSGKVAEEELIETESSRPRIVQGQLAQRAQLTISMQHPTNGALDALNLKYAPAIEPHIDSLFSPISSSGETDCRLKASTTHRPAALF